MYVHFPYLSFQSPLEQTFEDWFMLYLAVISPGTMKQSSLEKMWQFFNEVQEVRSFWIQTSCHRNVKMFLSCIMCANLRIWNKHLERIFYQLPSVPLSSKQSFSLHKMGHSHYHVLAPLLDPSSQKWPWQVNLESCCLKIVETNFVEHTIASLWLLTTHLPSEDANPFYHPSL
jgi:hypothetical protein